MGNNVIIRKIQEVLSSDKCLTALQAACASNISPKRLIKTTESLIRKTDSLQDCSVNSIYGAVLECATLGLEPILGRAYFVPFRNKDGQKDLQLIIGYQGLIELGRRGGVEAKANAVFDGDELTWESGFEENLVHRPNLNAKRDAQHLTFVYCVWKYNGEKHVEVMTRDDVEMIRSCSKCKNFGPWKDHYIEMAKKSVVRRAAKYWPLTIDTEVADAIERDDDRSFGDDSEDEKKVVKSGVDSLRERLGMTASALTETQVEVIDVVDGNETLKSYYAALDNASTVEEVEKIVDDSDMACRDGVINKNELDEFIKVSSQKMKELYKVADNGQLF